jgi:hypothetical protein
MRKISKLMTQKLPKAQLFLMLGVKKRSKFLIIKVRRCITHNYLWCDVITSLITTSLAVKNDFWSLSPLITMPLDQHVPDEWLIFGHNVPWSLCPWSERPWYVYIFWTLCPLITTSLWTQRPWSVCHLLGFFVSWNCNSLNMYRVIVSKYILFNTVLFSSSLHH